MALLFGLFLALAVWVQPSHAQDSEGLAPVRLVTGSGYYPYTDLSLEEGGLATEIVMAAYRSMQFIPDVKFGDWQQGYADTLAGRFDATFPYLVTPERKEQFYYSDPLLTVRQVLFVRAGSGGSQWMLRDLQDRSFCLPRGYALPFRLQGMAQSGAIRNRTAGSVEQCFENLSRGRVDFVPVDILLGSLAARVPPNDPSDFTLAREDLYTSTLHLIVPKQQADARAHIDEFNRALEGLRVSGRYGNIITRHQKRLETWSGPRLTGSTAGPEY